MTREINGRIVMRVSDDGTRCAAECPQMRLRAKATGIVECIRFGTRWYADVTAAGLAARHPACIAAEVSTVEGES